MSVQWCVVDHNGCHELGDAALLKLEISLQSNTPRVALDGSAIVEPSGELRRVQLTRGHLANAARREGLDDVGTGVRQQRMVAHAPE